MPGKMKIATFEAVETAINLARTSSDTWERLSPEIPDRPGGQSESGECSPATPSEPTRREE